MACRPTVLVYRSGLLPHSETFIREQILAYRDWRGVLIGHRLLNQLPLDGLRVRLVDARRPAQSILRGLGFAAGLEGLQQEKPCLLHAHFGPEAVAARQIAHALRLPMIVTLHGYDITIDRAWWESGAGGAVMRNYPRQLLRIAATAGTHFVAVSEAIRECAIAFGIPSEKVTVAFIGIDVAKFIPGPIPLCARAPRILFVGRLVEKKGCQFLLQAMRHVREKIKMAELVVIGDGPERAGLEALARELGGGIQFLGALPPERVKSELDAARVFCLPSVRAANGDAEGFGLVLLEAQASGVPVVTSAMGGAQEGILDGETGYRVGEGDVVGLANHLIDLLSQPDKAMAMGQAARRLVCAHFDIHECTRKLETLYGQIARLKDYEPAHAI